MLKKLWPEIIITKNTLGENLSWNGQELVKILRNAYLSDLVNRKGISNMQAYSKVPIIPTPAVVQNSFKAILNLETKFHFSTPLLMLDIGGATTDLFFGGELLPDNGDLSPRPSINRHVFTDLGVYTSKDALLEKLSISHRLSSFLQILDPINAEEQYLSIRENQIDWMTIDFLAEACFFLALEAFGKDSTESFKLDLHRVACILITGGASQICDLERLKRIAKLCGASNAQLMLDDKYQIWIEGMK